MGDMSVACTQGRFPPAGAHAELRFEANHDTKALLITSRHPNELNASRFTRHPSDEAERTPHGSKHIKIDDQLHGLTSL